MTAGPGRRNAVRMDLRLGFEALDRYDLTHDERDLAVALRELTEAYGALPVGDIWRPAVCDALGRATRHHAEVTGDAETFDAAVDFLREAVDAAVGHPLRYMFLTNLGRALADATTGPADPTTSTLRSAATGPGCSTVPPATRVAASFSAG